VKKRLTIVLSLAIIIVIFMSTFVALEIYGSSSASLPSKKTFYVGVTYCGNSTTEADQLIDRIKNYTNLFVLDSGSLIQNLNATEKICDYAVNSGLSIIVYYGTNGDETVVILCLMLLKPVGVVTSWDYITVMSLAEK
jgi:hypothetical protein